MQNYAKNALEDTLCTCSTTTVSSKDRLLFSPREAAMLARSWDCHSVRLSVRPSVTRVFYDETEKHRAKISTPPERVINQLL